MDTNTIVGAVVGVLIAVFTSKFGGIVLTYLYHLLGKLTDETETKIDDKIHEGIPDVLEFITEKYDLGTADKIIEQFLGVLGDMDEDTSELERLIKDREFEVLRKFLKDDKGK
ncbi:MAG: hypothetical protein ACOCQA_03140 [bacterium]